jgi:hypothetical protein
MKFYRMTFIGVVIVLAGILAYLFLPICLLPEMVGRKDICVKSDRTRVVLEQFLQNDKSTSSAQIEKTSEGNDASDTNLEKMPWENSTCGNGKCEACESRDSCCNYPPKKDKNGKMVYPPPTCVGQCIKDCLVGGKMVDSN